MNRADQAMRIAGAAWEAFDARRKHGEDSREYHAASSVLDAVTDGAGGDVLVRAWETYITVRDGVAK